MARKGAHAQLKQLTQKNTELFSQVRESIAAKKEEERQLALRLQQMQQQQQQMLMQQQQAQQPQAALDHTAHLFMEQQRVIQQQQQMLQQQLLQQQQALLEAQARAQHQQQHQQAMYGSQPLPTVDPMAAVQAYNSAPAPMSAVSTYQPPAWSSLPLHAYHLNLEENGAVSTISLLGRPFFIVGRADTCDIQLATPSVSRQHAAIQHRGGGSLQGGDEMYIYDLGSTSGTFLNGQQLLPRHYYGLLVGDSVVFANSPPFVVCGPKGGYEQQQQLREQHSVPQSAVSAVAVPPPAGATSQPSHEHSLADLDEDKIDAIVHAKVNAALMRGIAALDDQLARNVILEDEYFKRKCLLQDKIAKKQAELVQTLLKKKKEARIKQSLEDKASHQRAQQAAMKEERARQAAAAAAGSSPPAPGTTAAPSTASATTMAALGAPAQTLAATSAPSPACAEKKVGFDLDAAFENVGTQQRQNFSSIGTVKLDPKSEAFDVTAYKAMMVQKYELEQLQNSLLLRIRACGDPTSKHFDPVLYKRLMVEKYERDQQIAANKRKIMHAELLSGAQN